MTNDPTGRLRWTALATSATFCLLLCAATGAFLSATATPRLVIAAHGLMFLACMLVWVTAMQVTPAAPRLSAALLALGLAARLLLLPYPPSDDINRYLWEGRLVLEGLSPYDFAADQAPAAWRDGVWAAMNNKHALTVYPPLAQAVFAACVAIDYAAWPMKLLFIAAEMATLRLLSAELRRRRLPEAHLALFAVNPVLLLGTAGEAHFDSLFVLAMVAAVHLRSRGRMAWAWVALGAAVQLKLAAVVFVPLFLARGGWRSAGVFVAATVAPCLPFAGDLASLARGILAFGTLTHHNGFAPTVFTHLLGDSLLAAGMCYVVLAGWSILVVVRVADSWRAAFLLLGSLLMLSPVVHFWYVGWILPFVVLAPQPAWLLLSGLQALYATAWIRFADTGHWSQPAWVWWGQWLPFALLLAVTAGPGIGRLFARPLPRPPTPRSITAVVPALNEAAGIGGCLAALRDQRPALAEIIVVDGGSRDGTPEAAVLGGARVITTAGGRGRQIAAGAAVATGDVIWVVHADCIAAKGAAAAILAALAADVDAVGGAVGQGYRRLSGLLMALEYLNAARSALVGVAFGDQGQFVRREALIRMGGFPALPLMEDVELGLRLRRHGSVLHLAWNGVVSTRAWQTERPWRRAGAIVRITLRYLTSPNRHRTAAALFAAYYAARRTDA